MSVQTIAKALARHWGKNYVKFCFFVGRILIKYSVFYETTFASQDTDEMSVKSYFPSSKQCAVFHLLQYWEIFKELKSHLTFCSL